MLIVPEELHLFVEGKSEKLLALGKNLVHEVLAYSVVDKVEKPRICACLFFSTTEQPQGEQIEVEVEIENWSKTKL